MFGEEIVLQVSSSCLSLSSYLSVEFFFVYKTVASFLTLLHKNSQMLVKNAKFGTNFEKPVKITLIQFCKQRFVGEICLRFFFSFYPVLFSQILKKYSCQKFTWVFLFNKLNSSKKICWGFSSVKKMVKKFQFLEI